jgi:dihydrofolate reductase
MMRKLIVTNIVSLDGCYEGPGNNVMALPMDASFDAHNLERLEAADTLLLGRSTYDGFRQFWPSVADQPEHSEVNQAISRRNNAIDKIVISDSLSADDTAPWTDTTRILRRADSIEAVAELKRQAGKDILVFGSRTTWNALLAAGLVDELHLMVGPVALGPGTPLFASEPAGPFRLLGTRTFDGSDNVLVSYATS